MEKAKDQNKNENYNIYMKEQVPSDIFLNTLRFFYCCCSYISKCLKKIYTNNYGNMILCVRGGNENKQTGYDETSEQMKEQRTKIREKDRKRKRDETGGGRGRNEQEDAVKQCKQRKKTKTGRKQVERQGQQHTGKWHERKCMPEVGMPGTGTRAGGRAGGRRCR